MIAVGEDELICDLAETYGIYDMRSLPAKTLAILACGLKPESRIMRKLANQDDVGIDTLLLARQVDLLSLLVWAQTEDARHKRNRPKSMVDVLLHKNEKQKKDDLEVFSSPEDFMAAWEKCKGA